MIRFIQFKTHQNSGCPIKREELSQLVTKNYRHRLLPAYVINEAKDKLSTIFDYELRELQISCPPSTNQARLSQQSNNLLTLFFFWIFTTHINFCSNYNFNDICCFSGGADAKSYVIISELPAEVHRKYVEDVNTSHLTGFTFVVISIVHLAGGKITEGTFYYSIHELWNFGY